MNSENLKLRKRKFRIHLALREHCKAMFVYFAILGFSALALGTYSKIFPKTPAVSTESSVSSLSIGFHSLYQSDSVGIFIMLGFAVSAALISMGSLYLAGIRDHDKDSIVSVTFIAADPPLKRFLDTALGRHQIFKNSIRNWPELQTAFIISSFVMVAVLVVNIFVWPLSLAVGHNPETLGQFWISLVDTFISSKLTVVPAIFAPVIGVYGYLKRDYADKWRYCSDLAYKVEQLHTSEDKRKAQLSLVVDLMNLDLWAKRSFCRFFYKEIRNLIQSSARPAEWKTLQQRRLRQHRLHYGEFEKLVNEQLHGVLETATTSENHLRKVS